MEKKTCKVEWCESPVHVNGLCIKHNGQMYKHGRIFARTKYDKNEIVIYEGYAGVVLYDASGEVVGECKVDHDDINKIKDIRWGISQGYARSGKPPVLMHNLILGVVGIDHINRDRLDNRKSNLRPASKSENGMNKVGWSKTGFKGVVMDKGRFAARILVNGKMMYLGSSRNLKEAATYYNNAAKKFFGEFACLNDVGEFDV